MAKTFTSFITIEENGEMHNIICNQCQVTVAFKSLNEALEWYISHHDCEVASESTTNG